MKLFYTSNFSTTLYKIWFLMFNLLLRMYVKRHIKRDIFFIPIDRTKFQISFFCESVFIKISAPMNFFFRSFSNDDFQQNDF